MPESALIQELWSDLSKEALAAEATDCPLSRSIATSWLEHSSFREAVAEILTSFLENDAQLRQLNRADLRQSWLNQSNLDEHAALDLMAARRMNQVDDGSLSLVSSNNGFIALQCYRFAAALYAGGRRAMAVAVQNATARLFGVDIHPAATVKPGIFLDHGIGTVIGETAVVEEHCAIWHGVTLGGTLTETGDRHPKVRAFATIGAGAIILGNVEIGRGAVVAAGSVVTSNVPPETVFAGPKARQVRSHRPNLNTNTRPPK